MCFYRSSSSRLGLEGKWESRNWFLPALPGVMLF